ncbi:hypothetical protein ASPCAL08533 [Aspergillus calidoustus]|uniref:NACHT domain-containing protein n=1 Tax=Aspergillus calidoustus TaxID=454130 RepID=A0A0U5CQQ8_ASPCI|nr:hypothetical protein ASPCAL08533 [Aspergillus calidoustus]
MASTMSSPIDDSAFKQAVEKFRGKLTPEQAQDFQLTTIDDLKSAIAKLQNQQMSERKLRNLKRLESFVLRMGQFEQVVTVYLNASMFVGFVWGPVKCLLLTASSYHAAFDALLEMYERIGLNLPQLEQYQSLFQSNAHMRTILHLIYADILRFHKKALKFFKHPVWKQLFRVQWDSSKVKFSRIIESFQSHKMLLESQASLVEFTEHRKSVAEREEKYRREKDDEDRRKRRAVRNWLSAANSGDDQANYIHESANYPGTGEWILRDSLVGAWSNPSIMTTPLLWLTGIPGAGKTILAARIVQELQKSSPEKVIFFFCKHGDQERDSFLAVARGLLNQLLRHNKALVPHLYDCATDSATGTLTSIFSAQELLGLALRSLPSIFIVLDGVDECPSKESRTLVSWIRKEVESINNDSGDARCLFVSQDDQICNQLLKDIPLLKVTKDRNMGDLRIYCDSLSSSWVGSFHLSEDRRNVIVQSIVDKAAGMFLFARLVMHNLCSQVSRADFNRETSSEILPNGLDEAYDRIITRILVGDEPQAMYARRLLGWLVCAKRSLNWHEIQGAVSIDLATRTIEFEDRRLSLDSKQLLGSLIELRGRGTIELVHTTARSYLLNKNLVVESDQAYDLLRLCLVYLNHPSCNLPFTDQALTKYVQTGHYAFLDYAVAHWIGHLEDCLTHITSYSPDAFQDLCHEVGEFLRNHGLDGPKCSVSRQTQIILTPFESTIFYDQLVRGFEYWKSETTISCNRRSSTPILDLNRVIEAIRTEIESMALKQHDLQNFYGEGLFKCNRPYCQLFVVGFTDWNSRDQHLQEHERVFICKVPGCPASQLGFASQDDLDSHDVRCHQAPVESTAFPVYHDPASIDVKHACTTGNLAMVERWAEQFGPDELEQYVWGRGVYRGPAMGSAIDKEQVGITRFLLDKSLHPGKHILTVIGRAYREKRYTFLRCIFGLSHIKPDTSEQDKKNIDIWVRTMFKRHDDAEAQELLEYFGSHGMGIQRDWIATAIEYDCMGSLKYLTRAFKGDDLVKAGESAMCAAANFGKKEVCKLLLDQGLWHPATAQDQKPLENASKNGEEDILHMLLDGHHDTNDSRKWLRISQLYHSARLGRTDTIKQLLEDRELPLDLRDRNYCTPLQHAVRNGHLDVVSLLLDSGREVKLNHEIGRFDDIGVRGASALGLAVFSGHVAIVKRLLQCKNIELDKTAHLKRGRRNRFLTPREIAEEKDYLEILDAITECGARQKGVSVEEWKAMQEKNASK